MLFTHPEAFGAFLVWKKHSFYLFLVDFIIFLYQIVKILCTKINNMS